jgi:hypothetical protein
MLMMRSGAVHSPIWGSSRSSVTMLRWVEACVVQGQVQGHFPAQVEVQPFPGLFVAHIVIELQPEHVSHGGGRQAGTTVIGAIQVFRIVVVAQHVADSANSTIERIGRDAVRQILGIKQATLCAMRNR